MSGKNWFKNLRKLFIDIQLTNIRHGIALAFVLKNCVCIEVLHLEVKFNYRRLPFFLFLFFFFIANMIIYELCLLFGQTPSD